MLDFICGTIVERKPDFLILEQGGVGFHIRVSLHTSAQLAGKNEARIFTWLKVSDDGFKLYGFASALERSFFCDLVSRVAKLGPAKALSILSCSTMDELIQSIAQSDQTVLTRIKGIGSKLADRLIVEMKEVVGSGKYPINGEPLRREDSRQEDTVRALMSLGYQKNEVTSLVQRVIREIEPSVPLEEVVKRCLQNI